MKYMNVKKLYKNLNLQAFAEGDDGGNPDDGDDQGGEEDPDEDGDDDSEEEEERKYSQKEIDEAIKKRLAREKRKWQRQQQKTGKPEDKPKDKTEEKDDAATRELQEKAAKAEELELKWVCLEHDVDKKSVDDVLALAKVYMAKDDGLDIEDAIDEVLKKYPSFKTSAQEDQEEDEDKKAWGQRQKGKGRTKLTGVEQRFYELNPDLKK